MNNTTSPLVSIVIPIYNASLYLNEALTSIKKQTYKELEIICVDDGSTDNSVEIINRFIASDKRFSLIKQENQYAGIARNRGLEAAKGEYIIFLDSDDVFEKEMISTLVNTARKEKTDTVVFNYFYFSKSKFFRKKMGMKYENVIKKPIEIKDEIFQVTIGAPWNRFYLRKFVLDTGLKFQGTLNSNDIFFTRLTALYSTSTYYLDKKLVNYRIDNKKSLQGNINKSPTSFATAFIAIYEHMEEKGFLDTYRKSVEKYAVDLCITALNKVNTNEDLAQVYKACCEIFQITGITENNEYVIDGNYQELVRGLVNNDFAGFVTSLFIRYKSESILKTSIEYRVGRTILGAAGVK